MSDRKISYQLTRTPLSSSMQPLHSGRIPRVTRLMALAIRFEQLLHAGTVWDYADLARLGCVSRARITQIMSLLHLAPDIQEALLLLPVATHWREAINEHNMRPVAALPDFACQRERFEDLKRKPGPPVSSQASEMPSGERRLGLCAPRPVSPGALLPED